MPFANADELVIYGTMESQQYAPLAMQSLRGT